MYKLASTTQIFLVPEQGDVKMKMCDWTAYFMSTKRQKTLNVISLEFSRTRYNIYIFIYILFLMCDLCVDCVITLLV